MREKDQDARHADEAHGAEARARAGEPGRGRQAERPRDIPARGWRDILLRVKQELNADNISIVAAGVAFYALFAIVPGLAALVSIYGVLADPADVQQLIASLQGTIPSEARTLLDQQLTALVSRPRSALSLGAVGGILLAIWSASKGTRSLMRALNIVYNERERRGFVRLNATALALTLAGVVGALLGLGLVVVLPAVLQAVGLGAASELAMSILRWPLLVAGLLVALAALYRYAPSRERPRWRWVTWGSGLATLLWLGGSALFSFYVSRFGSYDKTYGSLGAVVILLLWFYLTAYVVLLGAEVNAEMEHQTTKDTTTGEPRPLGERRAHVADTVGETP